MHDETDTKLIMGGAMPNIFGNTNLHNLLVDITKQESMPRRLSYTSNNKIIVLSKEQGENAQPTNQKVISTTTFFSQGIPQPVDIVAARSLKDISPHHASCIQTKKYSIMGLGFVSDGDDVEEGKGSAVTSTEDAEKKITSLLTGESFVESKVDTKLDPLTIEGFALELYRVIEDFLDGGTGYLEVVRDTTDKIIGLNWMPYQDITVSVVTDESLQGRMIYEYRPQGGGVLGHSRKLSIFGLKNRQWVYDKFYKDDQTIKPENVSEIIAFKIPSNRSKWYGYPEWLASSTFITLLALSLQYKSDFYTNRGVLAYILSVMGEMDEPSWKKIEAKVQGSVGGGNNFRNLALKVGADTEVKVDKLASTDKTELQFSKDSEVFSQNIVSGHRVPPILANILITGKLGASNETVQAIISFQLLVIGPLQNIVQQTLGRTLGAKDGGIDGLGSEDFRLRKITSQFDIQGLDTVGRMREEAVSATESDGSQRDVSQGLKD